MNDSVAPRPVCFMVMPFGIKDVANANEGAPARLDCNALWEKAFKPAIEAAGYIAVRADMDTGAVIVQDMIERLAYADLVLADVSLPNGNVYYEVGLRHAAREKGCILFCADWSRQLFDIDQFTATRYALTEGTVPDRDALRIRDVVRDGIARMRDTVNPWHKFVSDQRSEGWSGKHSSVFHQQAEQLSAFQAETQAVRLIADAKKRKQRIRDLLAKTDNATLQLPSAALELLMLVRDSLDDWSEVKALIERLPEPTRNLAFFEEQRLLAESGLGNTETALAFLRQLVEQKGATPERMGLIGGRLKRLWNDERNARLDDSKETDPSPRERSMLNKAIEAYEHGMRLEEGTAVWKLDSTLSDIDTAIELQADKAQKDAIIARLTELRQMASSAESA